MDKKSSNFNETPLLFTVFIIAICGIIYELIVGAISSYLLGNSVKQYSITIGLFMSAMGIGSHLSKRFQEKLFDCFVTIELLLGLFGGFSAIILFAAYGYTKVYTVIMYMIIIIIGTLVGLEIPILTRIIEESKKNIRLTIANVLSFDYVGALLGSLAFPLLLLPYLGEIRTSFLVGFINISVAILVIYKYKSYIHYYKFIRAIAFVFAILIIVGFISGDITGRMIEDRFYRDKVIYRQQTKYQKMVLTKHRDDLRLFLDGNIQFSSMDEYRYHEALVHPAMALAEKKDSVLVLGGGDGLAVREILKYEDTDKITLVDLDPHITTFSSTNPLITDLNDNALTHEKVTIVNEDAYKYVENSKELFDVILVDLPDPNNESINKLYTNLFYRLLYNHLSEGGMVAIQSTSPYYANKAYWSIRRTVESEFDYTSGYHLHVPSFGDWGFTMASNKEFSIDNLAINVETKYLNDQVAKSMFFFGEDELKNKDRVEINSLTNTVLIRYYEEAWNSY